MIIALPADYIRTLVPGCMIDLRLPGGTARILRVVQVDRERGTIQVEDPNS